MYANSKKKAKPGSDRVKLAMNDKKIVIKIIVSLPFPKNIRAIKEIKRITKILSRGKRGIISKLKYRNAKRIKRTITNKKSFSSKYKLPIFIICQSRYKFCN
jgi:hypothetical protein